MQKIFYPVQIGVWSALPMHVPLALLRDSLHARYEQYVDDISVYVGGAENSFDAVRLDYLKHLL